MKKVFFTMFVLIAFNYSSFAICPKIVKVNITENKNSPAPIDAGLSIKCFFLAAATTSAAIDENFTEEQAAKMGATANKICLKSGL